MKRVQVLMSTYNGEKYLDAQIESLSNQEGVEVAILVRDDGSVDNTINILKAWEKKVNLKWYTGANLKPALSFMDLINHAQDADYYSFCDQDDVWDKDKLKIAVDKLDINPKDKPSLYFSRTRLVDKNLKIIKEDTRKTPRITLGSALIINPVTGCTAVFNSKMLEILRVYNNNNIFMHDGWTYRVAMAMGANIVFDETPHISYRQHDNNVVGGQANLLKKYKRRLHNTFIEKICIREKDAIELLNGYGDLISEDNRQLIYLVANYRKSLKNKLKLIFSSEIKTNNLEHNISFVLAVLFNAF